MYTHDIIANHLNGSRFDIINPNMQRTLNYMFGRGITINPIIRAEVISDNRVKPNLEIEIDGRIFYLSVLNGHGNSVHEEQPTDILSFMQSLGAPQPVIDCITNLCYSPQHTSGFIQTETITNRARLNETRQFFYNNRRAFIERALRTGIYNTINTQYVYWGSIYNGYIRSVDDAITILTDITAATRLIAVGGLALQRKDRKVNNSVQLKWSRPDVDLTRP